MLNSVESSALAPLRAMPRKTAKEAAKPAKHEEVPGQAARLKLLRKAFGYPTAAAFAEHLDIGPTRYNPFENGAPLTREVAFMIVRKFPGVSLDWLYFDKPDGLPLELARRLGVFAAPGKRKS